MNMINKNKKMKAEDYNMNNIELNSVCQGDLIKIKNNNSLRRQGALNIFNYDKCEFMILEKIQSFMCYSKDKTNLFYKKVERSKFTTDEGVIRFFGYKCKMVRDLSNVS